MSPDDIRQDIELKVVELLKRMVEEGRMTEERSQQIAQMVLSTLKPGMSLEELMKAVPKLDDTAPELSLVILPYLREYERMVQQKAQIAVADLIRQGKYNAATKLSEQVINQEGLVWTGSAKAV